MNSLVNIKLNHIKKSLKQWKIKSEGLNSYLVYNKELGFQASVDSLSKARDLILDKVAVIFSPGDELTADLLIT